MLFFYLFELHGKGFYLFEAFFPSYLITLCVFFIFSGGTVCEKLLQEENLVKERSKETEKGRLLP